MKACLRKNKWLLVITVVLSIITSAGGVAVALFLQRIIDVTISGDFNGFFQVIIASAIYLAAFGVLYFVYDLCSKLFLRNFIRQMRARVFHGVLRRGYQDFTENNTADYISALTNDIKLLEENYVLPLLLTLQHAVTFLVTLVLLLFLSPLVTLCLVVCMVFMYTIPSLLGKKLQKRQEVLSDSLSRFTSKLKDIFSGYEVIKAFCITKQMGGEFDNQNKQVADAKFSADKMFVLNESVSQMLAVFTQMASIFLASYLVLIGNISMGTLIALVQLGSSFVWPVVTIMQNLPKIKGIRPVITRLDEFSDYHDNSFTGVTPPSFDREVSVKNLTFSYNPEQQVLRNTSLTLQKGKKYAVVGKSGCGKSTLTKLLTGCYAGYQGEICFDGEELKELDIDRLKRMIAVIHQNVYMFDKDIKDNICLYGSFSEEELQNAIAQSGLQSFLSQAPQGIRTPVGENGALLSGGQRQRVAIARALIQKTPLLILDEGTSAIDMQTAYDIESRLLSISGLTLVTITHKMSEELLGRYDEILYMEDGAVIETGGLSELLQADGAFAEFYRLKE